MERISRERTPPTSEDLAGLLEAHALRFQDQYGDGPLRLFFTPGRVNLMGAHLDYNGGPVMPMAIDRGTFVAARPRGDRCLVLSSTSESGGIEIDLDRPGWARAGTWTDYPVGVVQNLGERLRHAPGLDVLYGGNLPIGAGLSSSASICIATALALDRMGQLGLSPLERVQLALAAEREFVGVQCGIMDPYAIGLAKPGHLLWLDCKDVTIEHLPLDAEHVTVAVADTGVRRELAQGAFNERVQEARAAFEWLEPHAPEAECLRDVPWEVFQRERERAPVEPAIVRRAEHVLSEVQRTLRARESLIAGDIAAFGAAMTAAQGSLRDLYEVSVPELDCLVSAALEVPGVYGGRLTGAGFGGCVALVAARGSGPSLSAHLDAVFSARFGRSPAIELFAADEGPREVRGPWNG